MEKQILHAQLIAVTNSTPQDAAQHIAAPLVVWIDAVADQERGGSAVIGDHTQGDVLLFTGMVESLGRVCAEHGLEAVTAEHDSDGSSGDENEADEEADEAERSGDEADPSSDRETDRASLSGDVSLDAAERGDGFSGNARDGARPDVSHLKRVSKPARDVSSGGGDLNVPAPVPEMSELREIQMMARSQAIGGAEGGAWSEKAAGGPGKRTTRGFAKTAASREDFSDRNTSGGETSATSGAESEGFDTTPRGAWNHLCKLAA